MRTLASIATSLALLLGSPPCRATSLGGQLPDEGWLGTAMQAGFPLAFPAGSSPFLSVSAESGAALACYLVDPRGALVSMEEDLGEGCTVFAPEEEGVFFLVVRNWGEPARLTFEVWP